MTFEIRGNQFVKDGKPVKLISGAVHYFRNMPDNWTDFFKKMKALGCNCAETYCAWNMHEKQPVVFDFSGNLNIAEFIKAAGEEGLMVIVRPGPYICAEREFGGLPWWIQTKPNMEIRCSNAFQRLDALPDGYAVPEGRVKPWGTGHAILSCDGLIDAPFAVIYSDDYYGREAFQKIFDILSAARDTEKYQYSMVGYKLGNTLTDFGSVARGVCEVNEDNMLLSVTEHTRIEKHGDKAEFTEDGGESWTELPMEQTVSMNLWGFTPNMIAELKNRFPKFLESELKKIRLNASIFCRL